MAKTRDLAKDAMRLQELRPEELAIFALPDRETLSTSGCCDPCGPLISVKVSVGLGGCPLVGANVRVG